MFSYPSKTRLAMGRVTSFRYRGVVMIQVCSMGSITKMRKGSTKCNGVLINWWISWKGNVKPVGYGDRPVTSEFARVATIQGK
jgi:hypothetical protein